ncbi:hypothetical protein GYA19_02530 [Candidatus Beckwithbacteria bacterium]|nr:hypothetical protein [Candidatus Beckwithbacteria bacterium]
MTDFYHYKAIDFAKNQITTTIATGPVVINDKKEFLLHISPSTNKYQFAGGRLTDTKSSQENVIFRPWEDMKIKVKLIQGFEPFVVVDEIVRDGQKEIMTLIHYLA